MNEHIIRRFDDELDKLRSRLIKMGSLVQEQFSLAIKSLKDKNCDLAKAVSQNDEKINKLDLKIDKQCLRIFALHQPVAMDLRLVMSAVNINDDLEIIGDAAANVADDVVELCLEPDLYERTKMPALVELTEAALSKAIDSIIYNDVELAREVVKTIPVSTKLWRENIEFVCDVMKSNPEFIQAGAYLIDIARNLQFITDMSVNVAQEVVFLVEAKIVKHKTYEELIAQEQNKEQGDSEE